MPSECRALYVCQSLVLIAQVGFLLENGHRETDQQTYRKVTDTTDQPTHALATAGVGNKTRMRVAASHAVKLSRAEVKGTETGFRALPVVAAARRWLHVTGKCDFLLVLRSIRRFKWDHYRVTSR